MCIGAVVPDVLRHFPGALLPPCFRMLFVIVYVLHSALLENHTRSRVRTWKAETERKSAISDRGKAKVASGCAVVGAERKL